MLPIPQRAWALSLAALTAWWVSLAFGRTARMAEIFEVDEAEIRALGARDIISALALLDRDPRAALGARAAFDLSDAARLGRGTPRILAMTGGFAALGALGLLARRG